MADPGSAAAGIIGTFVIAWLVFIFALILVAVASIIFWIFMLVDVVKRTFEKDDERLVWILVIVLTGVIGALIYYFVVKRADKKQATQKTGRKRT